MKVRMRLVFPALLALAGCASTTPSTRQIVDPAVHTSAAPPQRVSAVSEALGERLESMMAAQHVTPAIATR